MFHVWLIFLGGLCFSEGKARGVDLGQKGDVGRNWKERSKRELLRTKEKVIKNENKERFLTIL